MELSLSGEVRIRETKSLPRIVCNRDRHESDRIPLNKIIASLDEISFEHNKTQYFFIPLGYSSHEAWGIENVYTIRIFFFLLPLEIECFSLLIVRFDIQKGIIFGCISEGRSVRL